jgi:gliding motility-associated-like protein
MTISLRLFLFLSILISHRSWGQEFARTYIGFGDDRGHSVIKSSDGSFVIAGQTTSFGQGGSDFFLIKSDVDGNIIWQNTYGSTGNESGTSICVAETIDMGFVIVGGTTGFSSNVMDLIIVKVDQFGNLNWTRKYNTATDSEHGRGVLVAQNGDIIVSGSDNADNFGSGDGVVLRVDNNGNLVWSKVYGGDYNDHFHSLHELPGGNLIVVGSSTSFGPGNTAGFVLKLNSSGTIIWDYTYGSSGTDAYNGSILTNEQEIICVGLTTSFGGGSEILVTKLDTNGVVSWSHKYGGANFERGAALKSIPNSSDFYIVANTESYGNGNSDFLILRINESGQLVWSKTFGTNQNETVDLWAHSCMISLNDGGLIFTGTSNGMGGSGGNDIVLIRSNSSGSVFCEEVNVSSTPVVLSRINSNGAFLNTGVVTNVICSQNSSNFTEYTSCWCPSTPHFDSIQPLCVGSSFVLPTVSTNGINGTWSPSVVNTNSPGLFNYIFTPLAGECATPTSVDILINESKELNFNPIGPFCLNQNANLPSSSLEGISGSWSPNSILTSTVGIESYVFTPDPESCAQEFSLEIAVNDNPSVDFYADTTYGCQNLNVSFTANSDFGTEFHWDFGDGNTLNTGNSITHTFNDAGCFDIELVVEVESTGCVTSMVVDSMVCIDSLPVANFVALHSDGFCFPFKCIISNLSQSAEQYIWITSVGDTIQTTDLSSLSLSLNEPVEINLLAINEVGCVDEFYSIIEGYYCGCNDPLGLNYDTLVNFNDGSCIYPTPDIFVPNVFTPNNDGKNDFFELTTSYIVDLELIILNRWGNIMFEQEGINPKWNGYVGDDIATEGTYFYIYRAHSIFGDTIEGHGFFNLIQ